MILRTLGKCYPDVKSRRQGYLRLLTSLTLQLLSTQAYTTELHMGFFLYYRCAFRIRLSSSLLSDIVMEVDMSGGHVY